MASDTELLAHLISQVSRIEKRLDDLTTSTSQSEWLTPQEFAVLAGCHVDSVRNAVKRGVLHGTDAVRNMGTKKNNHLRFHRRHALDQFMKKVVPS